MGAAYSFVSEWRVPASPDRCWAVLERTLSPDGADVGGAGWWPGVSVPVPPARLAVGEELTLSVRSPLGYRLRMRLRLTTLEPRQLLAAASTGDLHGRGSVQLSAVGDGTTLVFTWDVETTSRWMNATVFVLRPVFERAHTAVMRAGELALRRAASRP